MKKKIYFPNRADLPKETNSPISYVSFSYDTKTGELKLIDCFKGEEKEVLIGIAQPIEKEEEEEQEEEQVALNHSELIASDKADMQSKVDNKSENIDEAIYKFFESCIELNKFIDEIHDVEEFTNSIKAIANVFQLQETREGLGTRTTVFSKAHTKNSDAEESIGSFWVEDKDMKEDTLALSLEDAFERILETNSPKPHSKYVVLRKQVGPIQCNAQYIFGNQYNHLYVDALTGNVTNVNPCGLSLDDLDY